MDDLIILPDYDAKRKKKLEGEDVGEEVHCEFVKFKPGQIGIFISYSWQLMHFVIFDHLPLMYV